MSSRLASLSFVVLTAAACGRTGLDVFLDEEPRFEDAGGVPGPEGHDAETPVEEDAARRDGARYDSAVSVDVTIDAVIDAAIDAPPSPLDAGPPPIDAGPPPIDARPPPVPPIDATPPGDADTTGCTAGGARAFAVADDGAFFAFDPDTGASQRLGALSCAAVSGGPYVMTVTRERVAYVLYTDWHLYRVDTSSLACSPTAYASPGSAANVGIAVSRTRADEALFVYGLQGSTHELFRGDLSTFAFVDVGPIAPSASEYPFDLQADMYDRVFAVSRSGYVVEVDPATGAMLGADQVPNIHPTSSWASLALGDRLLLFAGGGGRTDVVRWDLATKKASPFATIPANISGASAPPCPP